jgi:glycosyltransferase involved in cell wall biosynthesis
MEASRPLSLLQVGVGGTVGYHLAVDKIVHFARPVNMPLGRTGGDYPMRIAHLSSMTGFYGGEVCLLNLASGMRRRGHSVACVVRPDSRLRRELTARGVEVLPLPLVDWYEPVSVSRLRRWLVRRDIQILHTHLPRDYFIAATATLGTGVLNVGSRHQLHRISLPVLKRPFLSRFSAMIAVSQAVRRGLTASEIMDPERVVTIPNGIEWDGIDLSSIDLRGSAGVGPDVPVVGFVGRLCPGTGVETLLAAAALLKSRWPDFQLFILGDGPGVNDYVKSLQRLAVRLGLGRQVHFFGYVDNAASACATFDVQVVSSQAEPFGLVTVEAMAQGLPVAVTNSGGSPCLLDSPGLRREMGRRGRERVRRRFTLDHMLDATEALYMKVLGLAVVKERRATA